MRAVIINGEQLEITTVPAPTLDVNELRVAVKAVGINRADLLQRKGLYPAPPGFPQNILGIEFAGEVIELGSKAVGYELGDRVMGIRGGATYAEEITIHCAEAIPVPPHYSWSEAGAIPEAFLTAFDALEQLKLSEQDTILIHAITSSVGLAALQLARQRNATVLGSSRNESKLQRLSDLEFTPVLVQDKEFLELVGRSSVDAVMDFVGAAYLEQNLSVLKKRGRMICLGLLDGTKAELSLATMLRKRLTLSGSVLRTRPAAERKKLIERFNMGILPKLNSGVLLPNIDRVYPMNEVESAHQRMQQNLSLGKGILLW